MPTELCPLCSTPITFSNTWRYCYDCEREGCCHCLGPLELAAYADRDATCRDCVHAAGQLHLFPVHPADYCSTCFFEGFTCDADAA